MVDYRIQEVDGSDPATSLELHRLHYATFGDRAPVIDTEEGYWWLAYAGDKAVAFAGLSASYVKQGRGYLTRSGVLEEHRGHGLQVRLIRAREAKAKRLKWTEVVTDTTDNIPSANSLIRAGYRLFWPSNVWAFEHSLYWIKNV